MMYAIVFAPPPPPPQVNLNFTRLNRSTYKYFNDSPSLMLLKKIKKQIKIMEEISPEPTWDQNNRKMRRYIAILNICFI